MPADGSSAAERHIDVQSPGECFGSGAVDGFVAISATSGGRTLTNGYKTSSVGFPITVL